MALTPLGIPSQIPLFGTPFDAQFAFCQAQVVTATGFLGPSTQIDLGGANPQSAVGRTTGMWVLDITALKVSAGTETYQFALLGSNDVAFGNGNVELLAFHDFAAAATGRVIATLLGASPLIPPPSQAGAILQIPFTNLMQLITYRFLRVQATLAGTTPSVTVTSWISKAQADV